MDAIFVAKANRRRDHETAVGNHASAKPDQPPVQLLTGKSILRAGLAVPSRDQRHGESDEKCDAKNDLGSGDLQVHAASLGICAKAKMREAASNENNVRPSRSERFRTGAKAACFPAIAKPATVT